MPKTVALFVPCFIDQLQPQVAIDTVAVLRQCRVHSHLPGRPNLLWTARI